MKTFLVLVFVLIAQAHEDDYLNKQWKAFKAEFRKKYYLTEEEGVRKNIFAKHLREIDAHNSQRGITYVKGVNKFTDMEPEEYVGAVRRFTFLGGMKDPCPKKDVPPSFSWKGTRAVTSVKDQLSCGSSWAFAAVGAMEGAHNIVHHDNKSFSAQNLIDCTRRYSSLGCRGGWVPKSYEYVIENGLRSDEFYPYVNDKGECRHDQHVNGSETVFHKYTVIAQGDEVGLQEAVFRRGPVAIMVDATPWGSYRSGIFNDPSCSSRPEDVRHAALVVGWDKDEAGTPYWIVKNSWGTNWGEEGYIKLLMGRNTCGLANFASYPIYSSICEDVKDFA